MPLRPVAGLGLVVCACTTDLDGLTRTEGDREPTAEAGVDAGTRTPPVMSPPVVAEPPPEQVEPSTRFAFTVLNGVVDADRIFLCRVESGGAPSGARFPRGGLAYGQALALPDLLEIDAGLEELTWALFAAVAEYSGEHDCGELAELAEAESEEPSRDASVPNTSDAGRDAGEGGAGSNHLDSGASDGGLDARAPLPSPPLLRLSILPRIPRDSLRTDRSYLLALAGCVGGPAFSDPNERAACGPDYAPDRPTLVPHLVGLSSVLAFGYPSLQFLNATTAEPRLTLRSEPGATAGVEVTIASDVVRGGIAPYPPMRHVSLSSFGIPLSAAELRLEQTSNLERFGIFSWGAVLSASAAEALEETRAFTLVAVGPPPWFTRGGFWNAPRVVLVRSNPPR